MPRPNNTEKRLAKGTVQFLPFPINGEPPEGIDLWLLDMTDLSALSASSIEACVSADEVQRASQFKRNQIYFLATRVMLRRVLAHYLGSNPKSLSFTRGPHGKPALAHAPINLDFNLSHNTEMAVLAISAQGAVGVDIESLSERNYLSVAERYFDKRELDSLEAITGIARKKSFYQLWTLKEAFFKATGSGISAGLNKICFEFSEAGMSGSGINAHFHPDLQMEGGDWQFYQQQLEPNRILALAVNSKSPVRPRWLNANNFLCSTS